MGSTCVRPTLDLRNGLEDFLDIVGHNWVSTGDDARDFRNFEKIQDGRLLDDFLSKSNSIYLYNANAMRIG